MDEQTVQVENSSVGSRWHLFGYKFPRHEVVYFSQIIIIYMVILTCLINLTIGRGESNLWTALLASCLGYMMPNPSINKKNYGPLLHHPAQ